MSSCPICFEALSCKIKAKPDNCEHVFCLPCLERWAKQAGYCPVERTRFKKILNLETGAFIQIKSHKRKRKRRGAVYDFTNQCEICSGGDSVMLVLCDSCDLAYHTHCLKPPLESIPAGSWYCPTCISIEEKLKKKNGITKEVEADMGGVVGKLLHKTEHKKKLMNKNESIPKTKELNNSTPVIKNDNLLACYVDVISNFEDMIVKKKECKDASSSSKYLDSTIQDKMVTKFDTTGEISHVINSKFLNYKTFATNTYIKTKKSYSKTNSTTADMCLNESSGSSDINLQNFTLSSESLNVGAFYDDSDDDQSNIEKQINQFNSDFDYSQIKLFSETSSLLSDEFLENSTVPEKMPILDKVVEETSRRKSLDNMPAIDTDAELTSIRKLRSIREDAEKFFDNASYVEDSSSSCIKNANFKRSSQHSVPFRTLEKSSCDKNKPSKEYSIKEGEGVDRILLKDSSFLTPSIMNPPVRKRGRPRKEDQPKKDRLKATITQLLETCVNNEEIKYDSPNFQPRVVLTRINDVSAFKSLTKVTHNGSLSSDADEESGINPYHFNEKGDCSLDIQNEKSLLSDQEKESKSNYKTSVSLNENKRDFSDTENENSFTSDEESRYNNKTPSSLSENEMNFSDTQNENSFISDEEEETDYNNNENSAFSSENVESVINNQNKTAPAPLDFDINLAVINPDGSIFVPKSTLKHTETNPQSSKAALSAQSELNNCDSEFSNMEYFDEKEILSEKTQSSLSENEMNFSDVQSENSFAYDEEEETDYNENSDFSHENMESFVNNQNKPAPLSLNDLNLAVIKPDGSIFIPKSTLKPAETDSRISKDTLSAQSDLNQCTVNRDSQFSNQSVNVDYSDENESLTEDEIISVTDLTSRNQFMQLNNKSSATSTGSSQAEQSQYNYKSVSSDYVIENKELEQGSFCEDDIEIINIFEKPAADFKPSYNYPQFTSCQSTPAISATYVQNSQKCDTDIGNIIEFEESQYLQIKSDGMYLFNQ